MCNEAPCPPTPASRTAPTLDRYDIAILRELQADARLTNTELAARIGLSAAPTWRRVQVARGPGFITGYRAEIDRRKIGLGVLAFVRLDAERNTATSTRELEDAIRQLPEVDLLPLHQRRRHLRAAGDGDRPGRLLALRARHAADTCRNVKDLHTSFSLGEVKAGAALPLGPSGGAQVGRIETGSACGRRETVCRSLSTHAPKARDAASPRGIGHVHCRVFAC